MIPDDLKALIKSVSFDIIWSVFQKDDKLEIAAMPFKEALKFMEVTSDVSKIMESVDRRKREVLPNNYKKMVGSLEQEILTLTEFYFEFGKVPEGAK